MGISVADNFSYLGGKPLDGRIQYATLAAMKAMADATLYEGCEAYCVETDKYYTWKSSNTVDVDTGKWREVSSGGGSGLPSGGTQGQYLVKQSLTEGDADWQSLSAFSGATSQSAGSAGLVPAPSAGDEGKVLFGNGAWGNIVMPSADLSVLSNEAFIFDTSEKPVGMWHNRKLLYAKTFTGLNVTPQFDTWTNIVQAPANIDEMGFVLFARREQNSLLSTGIGIEFYLNDGYIAAECTQGISLRAINQLTVFYTKTTDSPLDSNEKFAGLTASGEVVYERTISITTARNVTTGNWNVIDEADSFMGTVDKLICGNVKRNDDCASMPCEFNKNNNHLRIDPWRNDYFNTQTRITIRYTKSS